jgi:hypothetical protein
MSPPRWQLQPHMTAGPSTCMPVGESLPRRSGDAGPRRAEPRLRVPAALVSLPCSLDVALAPGPRVPVADPSRAGPRAGPHPFGRAAGEPACRPVLRWGFPACADVLSMRPDLRLRSQRFSSLPVGISRSCALANRSLTLKPQLSLDPPHNSGDHSGRRFADGCWWPVPGHAGPAADWFCGLSLFLRRRACGGRWGRASGSDRFRAGQAARGGGPQAASKRLSHSCWRCQPSGRCKVMRPQPRREIRGATLMRWLRMVAPRALAQMPPAIAAGWDQLGT